VEGRFAALDVALTTSRKLPHAELAVMPNHDHHIGTPKVDASIEFLRRHGNAERSDLPSEVGLLICIATHHHSRQPTSLRAGRYAQDAPVETDRRR